MRGLQFRRYLLQSTILLVDLDTSIYLWRHVLSMQSLEEHNADLLRKALFRRSRNNKFSTLESTKL